jgi:uncharacterized protein YecA (UPF0149 family)
MSKKRCFHNNKAGDYTMRGKTYTKYVWDDAGIPVTPRNKIGRNEPCPCGSGKKYKRCCHGL